MKTKEKYINHKESEKSMNKKILVTLLIFFSFSLLISLNLTEAVQIEKNQISDEIKDYEFAEFRIVIENDFNESKEFSLKFGLMPEWSIITQPLYYLELGPGEKGCFDVFIKARNILPNDRYLIPFVLKWNNGSIEDNLIVKYGELSPSEGHYSPLVRLETDLKSGTEIDPREQLSMKVTLINYNILNYTDLSILVVGETIFAESSLDLNPLERKTIVIDIPVDPYMPPKTEKLTIALEYNDKIISSLDNIELNIKEYFDTKINETTEKHFLGFVKKVYIENNGNSVLKDTYKEKTNDFKQTFTKTEPESYKIKQDKTTYLAWDYSLKSRESFEIMISVSYVPLFIALCVIVFIIVVYYLFRSPILCQKKIEIKKEEEETNIVVHLVLKNRSSKQIKDVHLKEILPPILEFKRENKIGVVQPIKVIVNSRKGTLLEWEIDDLEPFEERIITYKAVTKLSIIGEIVLKGVLVTFKVNNKEKTTKSNSITVTM